MRALSYIMIVLGFLMLAGSAGSQDFYEQCRAAADCVAGDPPSLWGTIAKIVAGLGMLFLGFQYLKEEK
jgi:hypothetical protein